MTSMYIQEINSKCYFQKNVWIKKTIGLLNSEVICFVCSFVCLFMGQAFLTGILGLFLRPNVILLTTTTETFQNSSK